MARSVALVAAIAVALLAVSGAGGASAQAPPRGGTVVFGGPFAEPPCLTPFRTACGFRSSLTYVMVASTVLEAPFDLGPDLTWRPSLVSSYTLTKKPPYTLTYHIRPNAQWSDGVPITAADFVFTHRASLRYIPPEVEDIDRTKVRSVRAVDPKTVRIVLRSRFAGWHALIGSILPEHALRGVDLRTIWADEIVNPRSGARIGSGPFLLERWDRGEQFVLRRNPRWWGPHAPYLDRLVIRFVQGNALRDAFRTGHLDVASHFPPGLVPDLRQEPGVRVLSNQQGSGWDHLEFRMGPGGHRALRNKLVRRALAYGIDRAAIVKQVLRAFDRNAKQRDSVVYATTSPGYRPNWQMYRYRPALARSLLGQAGCRPGADGIYVCDGERLSLQLITPIVQGGFRPQVAELIKTQLRQVGVEVQPRFATTGIFGALADGTFDVALFGWVMGPEADADAKLIFGCGAPLNWTGYCSRLATEDLDGAQRSLDPEQQARVLNRADARIATDVPVLPLYQQTQSIALRPTVHNVGLSLNHQLAPLWNVEDWWLDR